ncbi:MAG TPA: hypothetical protein VEU09_00575 [Candidatus Binatia bacterium]|nr:hypothetical protein [Candidatus Binatia bacterium]
MQNALIHIRRSHPLFRGLLVLYLLGTLFLAAVHQHHDGLQGHDCALCTVAHTPATVAAGVDPMLALCISERILAVPSEQGWESESHRTTRSRAPPLV